MPQEKTRYLMECQTNGGGFKFLQEPTARAGISFPSFLIFLKFEFSMLTLYMDCLSKYISYEWNFIATYRLLDFLKIVYLLSCYITAL